ncbi:N-acetyltransferase family protein [Aquihabitans sp. McL0605]|uniref:GNAT family N-acetyltransferase n=1 Tax=Aquihabitans sp. McL0605 TaxID=3415671 RepID=UPI003CE7A3CD
MVIADPTADLLRLVTEPGDPPPAEPTASAARTAALIRRRFGLSLPPPFAGAPGPDEPIRVAAPTDGAAIAAIKWRAFGANYRGGVLADSFLDARGVVPPASFWVGRAMLPPSRRHRLLVWGRPGTVFGYLDAGPVHPDDADPTRPDSGEVYELYVDPTAQGRGGGGRLLAEAEDWFRSVGYVRAELSTLATNPSAQAFYEAHGWRPTGRIVPVDLGVVAFEEVRYARRLAPGSP